LVVSVAREIRISLATCDAACPVSVRISDVVAGPRTRRGLPSCDFNAIGVARMLLERCP